MAIMDLWCEKCQRETPHKVIGWGDYKGAMHQWYSCDTCYNEKVIAVGTQVRKGVFVQESAPDEKPAGDGFLSKLLAAFRG